MRRTAAVRALRSTAVAGAILGALICAGCVAAPAPGASATTPPVSISATPTGTPTPSAPALLPEGSAADNLPWFASVVSAVWAAGQSVQGRDYIDALVDAGFPKSAMEVTNDRTTVDNPADAIQFSVRWQGECLVGQIGPSTPAPTAVVLPELPTGSCLIGQTRPIDW